MHIVLRFRTGPKGVNRDGPSVAVKAAFVWFEGVNDLHIQFDKVGGENFRPTVKDGDYLAPNPETGKLARLYSLEIKEGEPDGEDLATQAYLEKLTKAWAF